MIPLLLLLVVLLLLLAVGVVVALIVVVPPPEVVKMEERREAADVLAKIGPMPMPVACLPSEAARLMVLGLDEEEGEQNWPQEEEEEKEEEGRLMLGVRNDDDAAPAAVAALSCIVLTRAARKAKVLVVRGESGGPLVVGLVPAAAVVLPLSGVKGLLTVVGEASPVLLLLAVGKTADDARLVFFCRSVSNS